MSLSKMTKEELELLSYTDIAKLYLEENKTTLNTAELFKEVCNLLSLSEAVYQEKITDFFQSLTTSKDFILLQDGKWDLKSKHSVKVSMDELYEEQADEEDYEGEPEDEMDEEDYIFTMIPYRGMFINISYQLMVQVYDQIIRGVFDEKMEEVIQYMKERNIDYMNRNDQTFKIVLVGGFGNYYLVKKQMTDKFKFSSTDERQKNIIMKREDCEKAISLGAALLASNVLRIRNTAPYSIGIRVRDEERISLTYGLRYNQDIEFNKIYMQNL